MKPIADTKCFQCSDEGFVRVENRIDVCRACAQAAELRWTERQLVQVVHMLPLRRAA